MSRFYFDWTPEKMQRARQLCDIGATASEIARDLGTTRNSVIGKLYRQGIKLQGRMKKYNLGTKRVFDNEGNFLLLRN